MRYLFCVSALLLSLLSGSEPSAAADPLPVTPLHTADRSPLVQIFGLPEPGAALIKGPGRGEAGLFFDVASNYAAEETSHERLILDGEAYRVTLACRYGLGTRAEAGLELPFVGHGGGIFDSFIEGWHDFFGLPQGGRKEAPRNRLLYSYADNGTERLRLDDSGFGIGDIRINGGYQLYKSGASGSGAVALRGSLKLPTGDSHRLRGSGSVDTALWLDLSDDYQIPIGHLTLFGSAGGMAMTRGNVLPDQQRSLAAFGTLGAGWAPTNWIAFIMQFSGHTPFYQGSDLKELSANSLQLHSGGTLRLPGSLLLDIAVSEDIAVNTAPDVTLHLALRRPF
ncbi:hypothetical protein OR1_00787 [Geobacter sp. OR-1]|uniref:DUF3187 family protein n=1 Tax=Geobacter sp. OR-1 TaxID=1266765 RepID=UPI000541E542|nr:DUF3187 family protein [Geobacter sp. OR-1]GAM08515.1 hypothetical protein OR1_00787 [Geobacter sp. OR-1]